MGPVAAHHRRAPGWLWLPLLVVGLAAVVVYLLVRPGSSSVATPAVPGAHATVAGAHAAVAGAQASVPGATATPRSSAPGRTAAPASPAGSRAGGSPRQVSRTVTVTGATGALIGGAGMAVTPAAGNAAASAGAVGVTLFGLDSATVDPAGRQVLIRAAALIRSSRPAVVTVSGYASRVGEPTDNLALSRRRAVAVAAVLRSELGGSVPRIEVVARGETGQSAAGTSSAAGLLDRRVVVATRAAR